jgi:hypothetical protein
VQQVLCGGRQRWHEPLLLLLLLLVLTLVLVLVLIGRCCSGGVHAGDQVADQRFDCLLEVLHGSSMAAGSYQGQRDLRLAAHGRGQLHGRCAELLQDGQALGAERQCAGCCAGLRARLVRLAAQRLFVCVCGGGGEVVVRTVTLLVTCSRV